ncbi:MULTISPECIES: HMA2 domain-containing protein [Nostocales]|nr:hypothetical protein [Tolypothrix bouteillei]
MTSRNLSNSTQNLQVTTLHSVNGTAGNREISYSIAHAIPGRIRFCIPKIATDSDYAEKLKAIIEESNSGITDVRINEKAASIAITYRPDTISDDQMRSHLLNLIQVAPDTVQPPKVTARPLLGAIFDALINFIDSIQNINKVRTGIQYGRFKTDFWKNLLSKTKAMTQKLKSAVMFVLPKREQKKAGHDVV